MVFTIPGGCLGFLNHQQVVIPKPTLRCSRSEGGDRETHADGHLSNNRVFETDAGSAPVRGTQRGGGGDSVATPGKHGW